MNSPTFFFRETFETFLKIPGLKIYIILYLAVFRFM